MPDPSPDVPDEAMLPAVGQCHCISLRKAARRISLYYDSCLAPVGLRATQFSMLAALASGKPLSVNALAAMLDLDRSTAGQNIKLLERDGLMDIIPSEQDRRARIIRLTAAGRARLAAAMPLWQRAQQAFEVLNGADEAAAMREMLKDMEVPLPANSLVLDE
ncbi:MarR family winged helix-turn-helix transcriptional regulator [Novosphingobium sp.]|uniref:MarR family winged helix-turn-helix transcriptional regulator n=1 Tax=Novosphingobium sp. TaxID=1874826 RepID=UPI0031E27B67